MLTGSDVETGRIEGISRLIRLTQSNELSWRRSPGDLTRPYIEVFEASWNDDVVFRLTDKPGPPISRNATLYAKERHAETFPGRNLKLEAIGSDGSVLFEFPRVAALAILLTAIKGETADGIANGREAAILNSLKHQ